MGLRLFRCPYSSLSLVQILAAVNDFSVRVAELALVPASRIRNDQTTNARHSVENIIVQATNRRKTLSTENERHSWRIMSQHRRHSVKKFQPYCDHQGEVKGM